MKKNLSIRQSGGNAIRVKVPASVAYDLKKINKVTATVLKELGCPACHSGFDIRFDHEREFLINSRLGIVR